MLQQQIEQELVQEKAEQGGCQKAHEGTAAAGCAVIGKSPVPVADVAEPERDRKSAEIRFQRRDLQQFYQRR